MHVLQLPYPGFGLKSGDSFFPPYDWTQRSDGRKNGMLGVQGTNGLPICVRLVDVLSTFHSLFLSISNSGIIR